jgi:hypothetical protein
MKSTIFSMLAAGLAVMLFTQCRRDSATKPAKAIPQTALASPAVSTPAAPVTPAQSDAAVTSALPFLQKTTTPKQLEVNVPKVRQEYPNLLDIKHFSTLDVVVIGSKARLGIADRELNEFANTCFTQLFRDYDLQPLPAELATADQKEFGTLNVIVETFPIGVSVELRMGTVGSDRTWTTHEMRVSSASSAKDSRLVKTSIATMLAKAAVTLRKVQGR